MRWLAAVLAAALAFAMVAVPAQAANGRPQPVANVEAAPGDSSGEIVVTWDAHPDGHKDHRVAFKPVDGKFQPASDTEWNVYPLDSTVTLTGLVPGAEYRVLVRARFADGTISKWARPVSGFAAEEVVPEPTAPDKTTTADETIAEELREHIEYPADGPAIDEVLHVGIETLDAAYYRADREYVITVTDAIDPTDRGSHRSYGATLLFADDNSTVPDWHPDEVVRTLGGMYNPAHGWVINDDGPGWGLYLRFTVATSGDYKVKVAKTGGYAVPTRVQVYRYVEVVDDCVGELDTNCSLNSTPGGSAGVIGHDGDTDWYRVPLRTQNYYKITMAPDTSKDKAAQAWLVGVYNGSREFLRPNGTVVQNQPSGTEQHTAVCGCGKLNDIASTYFKPTYNGDHYVALGTWGNSGDGLGHYSFVIEIANPTDLKHDDIAPGTIVAGGTSAGRNTDRSIQQWGEYQYGTIHYAGRYNYRRGGHVTSVADRDWFAVDLDAGRTYRIDMEGVTLYNPQIGGIYDATGTLVHPVAADESTGASTLDSRLDYVPTTTGKYYIEATVEERQGQANIGGYRLKVTPLD